MLLRIRVAADRVDMALEAHAIQLEFSVDGDLLSVDMRGTGQQLQTRIPRWATSNVAEDDLFNRYFILRRTLGNQFLRAFGLVVLYFGVETISQFLGCLRRLNFRGFVAPLSGRLRAFGRILIST